jgi:UDP-N-acetylenolpyruvoylglucosamine reductase
MTRGTTKTVPAPDKAGLADELTSRLFPETVIRLNEPLARRTTLRVGGRADVFVEPASEADLQSILGFCAENRLRFFVLGRGSNLLVRDGGFRGIVISLAHPCFSQITVAGTDLNCGAGARLKAVALEAKRHSLSGLEFFEGIPGSVGGALRMNAGAMGGTTFENVKSVRLMASDGTIRECAPSEMRVQYRACDTLKSHIALSAVFQCRPGDRKEIEQRMHEFSKKRWDSQPAAPSAGCMFKNPITIPAGRLIDELGLKGTRIGGAMVSLEHGNFIVTDGSATARQVQELIELIRARARSERSIELETEVQIIGED